ncbi:hypothetical protein PR248_00350 [Metamycoplasma hyosynoviae]|nr:hypothetical protein [Metamycoplasma hyosynoviae]MDC8913496.1 hypothetical protein [Metamycoplasma hyosynoviae]
MNDINKIEDEKSFRNYWKNSWNIFTAIFFFTAILLQIILSIIFLYVAKMTIQNALSIASSIIAGICVFIIIFRFGFGSGTMRFFKNIHKERVIKKQAASQYKPNASQLEKDFIIASEREKYEQAELHNKIHNKKTTNLSFYILIFINIICIILALTAIKN